MALQYQALAGHHDFAIYDDESGRDVALVRNFDEAKARLFAAAPVLLAALEGALVYVEDGNVIELRPCGFVAEVSAAIALAKGGA